MIYIFAISVVGVLAWTACLLRDERLSNSLLSGRHVAKRLPVSLQSVNQPLYSHPLVAKVLADIASHFKLSADQIREDDIPLTDYVPEQRDVWLKPGKIGSMAAWYEDRLFELEDEHPDLFRAQVARNWSVRTLAEKLKASSNDTA